MLPIFLSGVGMGLFSSKYKTQVATTVSRVIEDKALPNSIKSGFVQGLFDKANPGQVMENVMEEVAGSLGVKADRLFRFGRDKYLYGLPSGSIHDAASGAETVAAVIEGIVGQSVTFDYYRFGALNNLHLGWTKLYEDHGYDPKTNILGVLSTEKGKEVQMTNIAVVVRESTLLEMSNGSLDQWGAPSNFGSEQVGRTELDIELKNFNVLKTPKLFELDENAANDYMRVEYAWFEDEVFPIEGVNITRKIKKTGEFRIEVIGYDEFADWHQVRFRTADGHIGYWLYQANTGVYPTVDALHKPEHEGNGSYFPFAYFRYDKVKANENKNTEWYKQSQKMMKSLSIDFDDVTNAIHENPEVKNVEQAMFIMATPALSENPVEARYLFDYFNQMIALNGPGSPQEDIPWSLNQQHRDTVIVIQDARFKMSLSYRNIYKKLVRGSIGKIGKCTTSFSTEEVGVDGEVVETGDAVIWNSAKKSHIYRRQMSATHYAEIRVTNLQMTYFIYGEYTAVGDEEDKILLIPIDRSIAKRYSIPDREVLYSRGMHYVFNSRVVTEIKWYAQSWFRIVLIVIAIIVTIITYGQTWQTIVAALAVGTISVMAVMYMIAVQILKYLIVRALIRLFVKAVGVKVAFVVAIIAAVAGSFEAIQAGSMAGAPFASELLTLANGLISAGNYQIKKNFAALQHDAEEFERTSKKEEERLKEGQELLDDRNWLTPLVVFGETPTEYYDRTVHSGNIGVVGLEAISGYFDMALTLPKLSDTL